MLKGDLPDQGLPRNGYQNTGEKMTPTSQNGKILAHLKAGKTITPLEALDLCGSLRLGARIFELKADGHPIEKELIEVSPGVRVAQYHYTFEGAEEEGVGW